MRYCAVICRLQTTIMFASMTQSWPCAAEYIMHPSRRPRLEFYISQYKIFKQPQLAKVQFSACSGLLPVHNYQQRRSGRSKPLYTYQSKHYHQRNTSDMRPVALAVLLGCLVHVVPSHGRQASAPSVRRQSERTCFSYANSSTYPNASFTGMINASYKTRNCLSRLHEEPVLRCRETFSYQAVSVKNFLGQDYAAATSFAGDFLHVMLHYCNLTVPEATFVNIRAFFCSLYFPPCHHQPIVPCKELCENVLRECAKAIKMLYFPWPDQLKCSNFPSGQPVHRRHNLKTSTAAPVNNKTTTPPKKRNVATRLTRKWEDSLITTRPSKSTLNSTAPITTAAQRLTTPTTTTTQRTTTQIQTVRRQTTSGQLVLTKSQPTTSQTTTLQTTTPRTATTTTQTVAPAIDTLDSDENSDSLVETSGESLSLVGIPVSSTSRVVAAQNATSSTDASDEITSTVSILQYSPAANLSSEIKLTNVSTPAVNASKVNNSQPSEQTVNSLLEPLTKQWTPGLTVPPVIPPAAELEQQVPSDPVESTNIYDSATEAELLDHDAQDEANLRVNVKPKFSADEELPSVEPSSANASTIRAMLVLDSTTTGQPDRIVESKNQSVEFSDENSNGGSGILMNRFVCGFALVLHFLL